MAGISLGGHTAWRMASLAPGQLAGFAMVVGCPNLTSLLLDRLGIDPASLGTTAEQLESVSYERLEKVMDEQQKRRWPCALAELIREGDRKVYEEFPAHVPVLLCNGMQDQLVPAFYTASWVERTRRRNGGNANFFVQKNTGHSCTKEMVAMMAAWLGNMFEC
jgi:pimeloyl-ACP methyl ester carboxylesterase